MFHAPLRQGVELRLLEERHAPALFARVDQERAGLREWMPWVDATRSADDTLSFIRSSLEQFASNLGFAAGIWNQGRLAGVIGTLKIEWINRKAEFGYWIERESQGQGIVTDASRALVTHLFAEMDLNRVEIRCAARNVKSAAIPNRLGFKLEGTLREGQLLNGAYHDMLLFAMLKRDWRP